MDVVMLRWPVEDARRRALAASGVPRLLVVDGHNPAPAVLDPLEDWIRVPALEDDRTARMESLRQRAAQAATTTTPAIDDDGVIRTHLAWTAVPPVEAQLAAALLERFGAVVGRDELMAAAWPEAEAGEARNLLDVRILRLRRRLDPLGLAIRTVRRRGYLVEWAR